MKDKLKEQLTNCVERLINAKSLDEQEVVCQEVDDIDGICSEILELPEREEIANHVLALWEGRDFASSFVFDSFYDLVKVGDDYPNKVIESFKKHKHPFGLGLLNNTSRESQEAMRLLEEFHGI